MRKASRDGLKKYDFLSWLALYLSNLPNTNVAKINRNDDGMTKTGGTFSDCSEKSLFLSVSTNQSLENL